MWSNLGRSSPHYPQLNNFDLDSIKCGRTEVEKFDQLFSTYLLQVDNWSNAFFSTYLRWYKFDQFARDLHYIEFDHSTKFPFRIDSTNLQWSRLRSNVVENAFDVLFFRSNGIVPKKIQEIWGPNPDWLGVELCQPSYSNIFCLLGLSTTLWLELCSLLSNFYWAFILSAYCQKMSS